MRNVSLYICDGDHIYMELMASYIMRRAYTPFLVKTLDSPEGLPGDENRDGLLLIASSVLKQVQSVNWPTDCTIILNEGELSKAFESFNVVNKYQSADRIYDALIRCQAKREDVVYEAGASSHKLMSCWGVYSPVRMVESSALAKKLCGTEGLEKKVLLMDFSLFPKDQKEGMCLSDMIYYYKQQKLKVAFDLSDLIVSEGEYDYIRTVRCPLDLKDMTGEEWIEMLEAIEAMGIYDLLVMDFDSLPECSELLVKCRKLYVPYLDSPESLCQVAAFEGYLEMVSGFVPEEQLEKVMIEG